MTGLRVAFHLRVRACQDPERQAEAGQGSHWVRWDVRAESAEGGGQAGG